VNTKSILHSFWLLGLVVFLALTGEFLYTALRTGSGFDAHKIFPVTAMPIAVKNARAGKWISPETYEKDAGRPARPEVTLFLKSGNEVTGEIVSEDAEWITLQIEESKAGFRRSEIGRIQREET